MLHEFVAAQLQRKGMFLLEPAVCFRPICCVALDLHVLIAEIFWGRSHVSGILHSATILWSVSIGWISNYTFTIFRTLGSDLENLVWHYSRNYCGEDGSALEWKMERSQIALCPFNYS